MPYTMEDFLRESTLEGLHVLSPEERLKGLSPEERLKGLSLEERLKGLPPSEHAQLIEYVQKLQKESDDPSNAK